MQRRTRIGLIAAAVAANVALAAANLSAGSPGSFCESGWRACQCYQNGDPEGCCAVCASSCNGCKATPTPGQPLAPSTPG